MLDIVLPNVYNVSMFKEFESDLKQRPQSRLILMLIIKGDYIMATTTTTKTAKAAPAKNQNEKILTFLRSGQTLTEAQAASMFGVKRVSARVAELRAAGYPVYANVNKSGKTAYRLGRPSRAMIAAAYAAAGSKVFSQQ